MALFRRLLRSTDEFIERGTCYQRDRECLLGTEACPWLLLLGCCSDCRRLLHRQNLLYTVALHAVRRGPLGESSRLLFQFKTPEDLAQWSTFSDAELGGQSTAQLAAAEEPQASITFTASAHIFPSSMLELSQRDPTNCQAQFFAECPACRA